MFVESRLSPFLLLFLCTVQLAQAHQHSVSMSETAQQRCFQGNGLPDHGTGMFPNKGNPHSISVQRISLCVDKYPLKSSKADMTHRGSVGIALNGVQIRPGTADYYDPQSPRGFSRDTRSGWNLEGIGASQQLGMDMHLAHVDQRGLYHYHGVANAAQRAGQLFGYAADGFKIYYATPSQTSSYELKAGTRPSGPRGRYDGTYVQDWQYAAGSGSLDQCNGTMYKGEYAYFATTSYPFFPRCFWGTVSSDFKTGSRSASNKRKPPTQAIDACREKQARERCQFTSANGHTVRGSCRVRGENHLSCVPKRK